MHCILLSSVLGVNACHALVVRQALKLSEDYNLNEVNCVGLLVSAHQEVGVILQYDYFSLYVHFSVYLLFVP